MRRPGPRTREPAGLARGSDRASLGAPAHRDQGTAPARQHLVDLAEKGYTVDITNPGRLVSQLVPVREPANPLERLIAGRIIEQPTKQAASVTSTRTPHRPPGSRPPARCAPARSVMHRPRPPVTGTLHVRLSVRPGTCVIAAGCGPLMGPFVHQRADTARHQPLMHAAMRYVRTAERRALRVSATAETRERQVARRAAL